jgi:hypothetical protein
MNFEEPKSYTNRDVNKEEDKREESSDMRDVKYMLFQKVKIYKLLIEIGIDYFLYGNCFIFGEIKKNDEGVKEWRNVKRMSPSTITIDYYPDGSKTYKWNPPARIRKIVTKKEPRDAYESIPEIIRKAIEDKKSVRIESNRIFHFGKPSDSLMDSSWGTPGIANVLKLLMYRNILRQAQEAIAREHIVPLRIYYLNPQGGMNPGAVSGFGGGSQTPKNPSRVLADEITKSSSDPNYKIVSNVPVGIATAGGHGKSLLLTGEIDQIQTEILAGMNVPREFIFGGVSYSGSSISLKILENHFITYRLLLEDFINNFLIKELFKARGQWKTEDDTPNLVKASLSSLKMQDDVQQKQMIFNLNSAGKISDTYLLKTMGLDPDKELDMLKREVRMKAAMEREAQIERVETETQMKKAMMIQQADIQAFQKRMNEFMGDHTEFEFDEKGYNDLIEKIKEENPKKKMELHNMQENKMEEAEQARNQDMSEMAMTILRQAERDEEYGIKILEGFENKLSKANFGAMLYKMKEFIHVNDNPEKLEEISRRIDEMILKNGMEPFEEIMARKMQEMEQRRMEEQQLMQQQAQAQNQNPQQGQGNQGSQKSGEGIDMRPMPEQRPPRRESLE